MNPTPRTLIRAVASTAPPASTSGLSGVGVGFLGLTPRALIRAVASEVPAAPASSLRPLRSPASSALPLPSPLSPELSGSFSASRDLSAIIPPTVTPRAAPVSRPLPVPTPGMTAKARPALAPVPTIGGVKARKGVASNIAKPAARSNKSASATPLPVPLTTTKRVFAAACTLPASRGAVDAAAALGAQFLQQLAGDLGELARHARRRTVTAADAELALRRQRMLARRAGVLELVRAHLPRECTDEL